MQIYTIAVGRHMPDWVEAGFNEYAKRLPSDYSLKLIEVTALKRTKNVDVPRTLEKEEVKIKSAIPQGSYCIALDRIGKTIDTKTLSKQLQNWHDNNQTICFIIGGPEGLSPGMIQSADTIWSLSALTLPHPLVRIVLAEQLYRAWSIIVNHPYHR